ncbi:MAG TPA: hypothetical protein VHO70_14325 [Chitinispirillaceae bacterium]|nr:hypothetical protein [Chitinispirillaceae bacterium]
MKKIETPSDTVFEEGLKEILSSESQDCDHGSDNDSELQAPTTRPRLNFSASSRKEKKMERVEFFIRIIAGFAALGLLIYFSISITSKM